MGWVSSKLSFKWVVLTAFVVLSPGARAVQVVAEGAELACREYELSQDLRVYKDPSLFMGSLVDILKDRERGMKRLFEESPLLTTLSGRVHFMRLAPPRPFKNFGAIARLYEVAEPRLRRPARTDYGVPTARYQEIVPVQVCGDHSAYSDTLGFVLVTDLERAEQNPTYAGGLPPSTRTIPDWKPHSQE